MLGCPLGESLPLRECGLKFFWNIVVYNTGMSLPLRECGLKSFVVPSLGIDMTVTPLAGVWIEIQSNLKITIRSLSHSPCGSVD